MDFPRRLVRLWGLGDRAHIPKKRGKTSWATSQSNIFQQQHKKIRINLGQWLISIQRRFHFISLLVATVTCARLFLGLVSRFPHDLNVFICPNPIATRQAIRISVQFRATTNREPIKWPHKPDKNNKSKMNERKIKQNNKNIFSWRILTE